MDREFRTRIERLFAEYGVTDYHYDHGGKHPLLIARHGGAYIRYAIPSSGSDWRGVANCVAYLKRSLGLSPQQEQRETRPRRRHSIKRSRTPLTRIAPEVAITSRPSWQETLAAHFGVTNG